MTVRCFTAGEKPPPGSRVEWLSPWYEVVRGTYHGGCIWIPDGSSVSVSYMPSFWQLVTEDEQQQKGG